MMPSKLLKVLLISAMPSLAFGVGGCTADIHDNTVNVDATLDFKTNVDVNNVEPGSAIAVTMDTTGVVLVDPGTEPAPADVTSAAHFKIYLDTTGTEPLVVTAQASVQVTIPASTPPGDHKLICRLHKHDGTPTSQQQEISIKVVASVTVGAGDAG